MKKLIALLTFGMMTWAGTALAIPFQITGSTFSTSVAGVTYNSNSSGVFDIDPGEYFDFTFGRVNIPYTSSDGNATLSINFATPTTSGVSDTGWLETSIFLIFVGGSIDFGSSNNFAYSYGGSDGGLLNLNMSDPENDGVFGTSLNLRGRITNLRDPSGPSTAVPEPSALLLLGAGLVGLGLARRKPAK